jgi:hypothetical protein
MQAIDQKMKLLKKAKKTKKSLNPLTNGDTSTNSLKSLFPYTKNKSSGLKPNRTSRSTI